MTTDMLWNLASDPNLEAFTETEKINIHDTKTTTFMNVYAYEIVLQARCRSFLIIEH